MYEHWIKMEMREKEWTRAAEAAELGLKMIPNDKLLLYWAGNAKSRLAREFQGGLHPEKANKELTEAKKYLQKALKLKWGEKDVYINADIYRAIVLVSEYAQNLADLKKYFGLWKKEFPGDPNLATEWTRVSRKFAI
jgi:tetratricopeptide (TPR) repeat protein